MLVDQIERRQDSRTRTESEPRIDYKVSGNEQSLQGSLIELGQGGARLRLEFPHTPNTALVILGLPDAPQKQIHCHVRWVRKTSTTATGYEIGVSFV